MLTGDTFPALLAKLEDAARVGDLERFYQEFLPPEGYARAFLVTARHRTPAERRRVWRLVAAILSGEDRRPGRRPLAPLEAAEVDRRRLEWANYLRPAWGNRDALQVRLRQRLVESPSRRLALRRLLSRPRTRPSDVIRQLVAWDLGVSVRRVAAALREPVTVLHR